jgi:hypothetical protein
MQTAGTRRAYGGPGGEGCSGDRERRMEGESLEIALVVGTAVTALGTLALAAATTYLAKKTSDMSDQNRELVNINNATLEEIRTEREERERPRVIVYVDYDHLPLLYLVIRNVGGSAAGRVTFRFVPDLVRPAMEGYGEEEVRLTNELNMFQGAMASSCCLLARRSPCGGGTRRTSRGNSAIRLLHPSVWR